MTKRLFDITTAAITLLLLAPVLTLIAWTLHRKMGSPVFFRQTRIGQHGKPFVMVKFCTLTIIHP
jgi:lipopolysaccharide/colanic/teichoic acid biosynthesis glycosyltransferase